MTVIQINATYETGSTGKIMSDLSKVMNHNGITNYMVSGYFNSVINDSVFYVSDRNPKLEVKKNLLISRITGKMGYRNKYQTNKAIEWIKIKKPDIIHLHNIHGDWINVKLLFEYIKKAKIPVVWTLHDCWAFTGRCSHFELCGCEKWKTQCYNCTNKRVYPITYFIDKSESMYRDKKEWFSGIEKMIIVTPSLWLSKYVKESFLGDYQIEVINNGIDTSVFYPQKKKSRYYMDFDDKKIILGVASCWSKTKGFDDFIKLDSMIDHNKYQIVMVGLNERQREMLPKTILGISRTNNQQELAELYSGADVFINPTYQDNYPTTNLEAISCGTPVITYNTGGSPECISEDTGLVIPKGNVEMIMQSIKKAELLKNNMGLRSQNNFDKAISFAQYINLYNEMMRYE